MKKLVFGAIIMGGAVLGLRRVVRHARKLCDDHCGASVARCQCAHEATPAP
jgi:hypothetical protein